MTFKIASVEKRFKSPGPQPNGLQAATDGLWCIDQVDNKVYRQDYETGEILFEAPNRYGPLQRDHPRRRFSVDRLNL